VDHLLNARVSQLSSSVSDVRNFSSDRMYTVWRSNGTCSLYKQTNVRYVSHFAGFSVIAQPIASSGPAMGRL